MTAAKLLIVVSIICCLISVCLADNAVGSSETPTTFKSPTPPRNTSQTTTPYESTNQTTTPYRSTSHTTTTYKSTSHARTPYRSTSQTTPYKSTSHTTVTYRTTTPSAGSATKSCCLVTASLAVIVSSRMSSLD